MINFCTINYEINIKKTGDRDQNRPAGVGKNLAARLFKIIVSLSNYEKIAKNHH